MENSMIEEPDYLDGRYDGPSPFEEESEADPVTRNEFLRPAMQFLDAAIESRMDGRTALEAVRRLLAQIPVQAAYCPCCADQYDGKDGEVPAPTVVKQRSCGHWACDRCAKHCSDGGCANDGCADCMRVCEGCAEPHCQEHVVARCFCKECVPPGIKREEGRPAYCFESLG